MKTMPASAPDQDVHQLRFCLSLETPIIGFRKPHPQTGIRFFDMHYPLELGIVLSGRMRRYYQDWNTDLRPGQFYLCGMWELHGSETLRAPCDTLILVIAPELMFNLSAPEPRAFDWLLPFKVPPRLRPQAADKTRPYFLELASKMDLAFKESGERKKLRLRVLLMEALLSMTRNWQYPGRTTDVSAHWSSGRINTAINMVFSERRHVATNEAARACGLSRNYFSRIFRSLMGIDFSDFALRHRLGGAAEQARTSPDPFKKIAYDWGFTDESHLHRLFLRFYKCTPRVYRNKMVIDHNG